jgi:hypothetical protein
MLHWLWSHLDSPYTPSAIVMALAMKYEVVGSENPSDSDNHVEEVVLVV